jgi:hypothetical protein
LSSKSFVAAQFNSKAVLRITKMNQSDGRDSLTSKGCLVRQYYRLLDHRVDSNGNVKFLIEWKPTWVASDELINLVDLHVSRSLVIHNSARMKLTKPSDIDQRPPLTVADYKKSHEIMLDAVRKCAKSTGRVRSALLQK